jgi:hypothetical protein
MESLPVSSYPLGIRAFIPNQCTQRQLSARGTSAEAHNRSLQELAPRLTALINSNDLTDKLAGLHAIGTIYLLFYSFSEI